MLNPFKTRCVYFKIEPSETWAHANESMILKIFYLYGFVRWTKCIWWLYNLTICSFINFLSLQLNDILQSEIKQNYLQFKKITFITAIADNKIMCIICICGYCAPQLSLLLKLNTYFLQLDSLFSWNSQRKRKKLTNNYI